MIACPNCQRSNTEGDVFCRYCGVRLNVPGPAPANYGVTPAAAPGPDQDNAPDWLRDLRAQQRQTYAQQQAQLQQARPQDTGTPWQPPQQSPWQQTTPPPSYQDNWTASAAPGWQQVAQSQPPMPNYPPGAPWNQQGYPPPAANPPFGQQPPLSPSNVFSSLPGWTQQPAGGGMAPGNGLPYNMTATPGGYDPSPWDSAGTPFGQAGDQGLDMRARELVDEEVLPDWLRSQSPSVPRPDAQANPPASPLQNLPSLPGSMPFSGVGGNPPTSFWTPPATVNGPLPFGQQMPTPPQNPFGMPPVSDPSVFGAAQLVDESALPQWFQQNGYQQQMPPPGPFGQPPQQAPQNWGGPASFTPSRPYDQPYPSQDVSQVDTGRWSAGGGGPLGPTAGEGAFSASDLIDPSVLAHLQPPAVGGQPQWNAQPGQPVQGMPLPANPPMNLPDWFNTGAGAPGQPPAGPAYPPYGTPAPGYGTPNPDPSNPPWAQNGYNAPYGQNPSGYPPPQPPAYGQDYPPQAQQGWPPAPQAWPPQQAPNQPPYPNQGTTPDQFGPYEGDPRQQPPRDGRQRRWYGPNEPPPDPYRR